MKFTNIILEKSKMTELERNKIIREKDGYINATLLCNNGGKRFSDWYKILQTKKIINELSSKLNISCEILVDIKKGGNNKDSQGSWVHPRLGICLAQWISIKFMLDVSEWVEEWKMMSLKNTEKYKFSFENIEPDNDRSCIEKEIQQRLHENLGGEIEVYTKFGYIDLLTQTELIEIKDGSAWKHGLGQLLAYRKFYLKHNLRLHLFNIDVNDEISEWCNEYNVIVTYE